MIVGRDASARAHGDSLLLTSRELRGLVVQAIAKADGVDHESSHCWSGLRPAMSIGSVMFSIAVNVGIRLNDWKMKPIGLAPQQRERLVVQAC